MVKAGSNPWRLPPPLLFGSFPAIQGGLGFSGSPLPSPPLPSLSPGGEKRLSLLFSSPLIFSCFRHKKPKRKERRKRRRRPERHPHPHPHRPRRRRRRPLPGRLLLLLLILHKLNRQLRRNASSCAVCIARRLRCQAGKKVRVRIEAAQARCRGQRDKERREEDSPYLLGATRDVWGEASILASLGVYLD